MHRFLAFAVTLLAVQVMQSAAAHADELPIVVEAAWVREGPPVAPSLAGYMILENRSMSSVSVHGAHSDLFDRVEFHRATIVDGMARMTREARVEVPARGQTVFAPGGRHLMLIGPANPLEAGDTINLTLVLEDGREVEFVAPVRRSAPK